MDKMEDRGAGGGGWRERGQSQHRKSWKGQGNRRSETDRTGRRGHVEHKDGGHGGQEKRKNKTS